MANNTTTTFTAPNSNESYTIISGHFNPIHINPYFSDFAEPSLMACSQVPLHVAMWRTLLLKTSRELSRKFARGFSCVCAYTFL